MTHPTYIWVTVQDLKGKVLLQKRFEFDSPQRPKLRLLKNWWPEVDDQGAPIAPPYKITVEPGSADAPPAPPESPRPAA